MDFLMQPINRFHVLSEVEDNEASMDLRPYTVATLVGELEQASVPVKLRSRMKKEELKPGVQAVDRQDEPASPGWTRSKRLVHN